MDSSLCERLKGKYETKTGFCSLNSDRAIDEGKLSGDEKIQLVRNVVQTRSYVRLKPPYTTKQVLSEARALPGKYDLPNEASKWDDSYLKSEIGPIGTVLDMTSANAILTVYDALNEKNKEKMKTMPITRMATIAWQFIK